MSDLDYSRQRKRKDVCLALKTWPEVDKYLSRCKGVILPIGSIEQHGPTGAIGTDAMTAEAIAKEVAFRTDVLVAPTQCFGMAQHHLGFPGTMSLQPSTLMQVVHDLVLSLATHGFERIFVINGHGGNIASTKAAFAQAYSSAAQRGMPVAEKLRCKLANWFMSKSVVTHSQALYGDHEGSHATPSEIAVTLYLEPILREKQRKLNYPAPSSGSIYGSKDFRRRYPDGRIGSDPFLAKSEHGASILDVAASALSDELSIFLSAP